MARTIGLVLLAIVGLMTLVGVGGEYTTDTRFEGFRQGLFVLCNVVYAVLAVGLISSSIAVFVKRAPHTTTV